MVFLFQNFKKMIYILFKYPTTESTHFDTSFQLSQKTENVSQDQAMRTQFFSFISDIKIDTSIHKMT